VGFDAILNLINGQGNVPSAVGPALNPNLFNELGDNTWAFIMTPRSDRTPTDASSQQYPDEFQQL
jgi:hypothetical protein